MDHPLQQLNAGIKKEADQILHKLLPVLNSFGIPHVSGSYDLNLMTWRDLDIYLQAENLSERDFFVLGERICTSFRPVKMSFRNELIAKTNGLPAGLYWGIYLGNERQGAWKIDIWAVNASECGRLLRYCAGLKQRLTPETALQILDIKSQCWKDPEYRRSYNSTDIYSAIIDSNVADLEGFRNYLKSMVRAE